MENKVKDYAVKTLILATLIISFIGILRYFEQQNSHNSYNKLPAKMTVEDKLKFKHGL